MFLFRRLEGPSPLTGRARVVSEMIELINLVRSTHSGSREGVWFQGGMARARFGGLTSFELAALLEQLLNESSQCCLALQDA